MHSVTMEVPKTKYKMYSQYCFYRRKDAVAYMKANYPHVEFLEVISATLAESKLDNRNRPPSNKEEVIWQRKHNI